MTQNRWAVSSGPVKLNAGALAAPRSRTSGTGGVRWSRGSGDSEGTWARSDSDAASGGGGTGLRAPPATARAAVTPGRAGRWAVGVWDPLYVTRIRHPLCAAQALYHRGPDP